MRAHTIFRNPTEIRLPLARVTKYAQDFRNPGLNILVNKVICCCINKQSKSLNSYETYFVILYIPFFL